MPIPQNIKTNEEQKERKDISDDESQKIQRLNIYGQFVIRTEHCTILKR